MLEYIKSVIRSFFSSSSTIVFIEPIVEEVVEEPKVKKAVKKPTKHKPRGRKRGRPAIHPWRTTKIGSSFILKGRFNCPGGQIDRLKKDGIYYSQAKTPKGLRMTRLT